MPLAVQANEPLFLSTIRVDVMGQNADDARALAVEQAKRDALEKLFEKFVPEHKGVLMDNIDDKKLKELVSKVEALNEIIDDNRYRAEIRVSYWAGMFNDMITQQIEEVESDQQLLTTASLVLPVYETSKRLYLFESTNKWGQAWANIARNIGRGQLITPFGDSVDHSLMDAKEATTADFKRFTPLRRRYGVRDIVILHAKFVTKPSLVRRSDDGEEQRTLALLVKERRVQAKEDEVKTLEYIIDADEDKEKLMLRAARDLGIYVMNMQGDTAAQVAEQRKELATVLLVIPVTTMQRFAWLKEQLQRVPGIEKLEVMALKPEQADIQVFYSGTREILLKSMTDTGLQYDDRNNYLEIRL